MAYLYVFLDESGDFNFSQTGTKYYSFTSVTLSRPFRANTELADLRYDSIEGGAAFEYFHATEDTPRIRKSVFDVICRHLPERSVDFLIVEKSKIYELMRSPEKFYPRILGYLLRYVIERADMAKYGEILVFTDKIPINKKREAVEKAVKVTLASLLNKQTRYRLFHHDSKSDFHLQIADYCNWAIFRKWTRGDHSFYDLIRPEIRSEFELFAQSPKLY